MEQMTRPQTLQVAPALLRIADQCGFPTDDSSNDLLYWVVRPLLSLDLDLSRFDTAVMQHLYSQYAGHRYLTPFLLCIVATTRIDPCAVDASHRARITGRVTGGYMPPAHFESTHPFVLRMLSGPAHRLRNYLRNTAGVALTRTMRTFILAARRSRPVGVHGRYPNDDVLAVLQNVVPSFLLGTRGTVHPGPTEGDVHHNSRQAMNNPIVRLLFTGLNEVPYNSSKRMPLPTARTDPHVVRVIRSAYMKVHTKLVMLLEAGFSVRGKSFDKFPKGPSTYDSSSMQYVTDTTCMSLWEVFADTCELSRTSRDDDSGDSDSDSDVDSEEGTDAHIDFPERQLLLDELNKACEYPDCPNLPGNRCVSLFCALTTAVHDRCMNKSDWSPHDQCCTWFAERCTCLSERSRDGICGPSVFKHGVCMIRALSPALDAGCIGHCQDIDSLVYTFDLFKDTKRARDSDILSDLLGQRFMYYNKDPRLVPIVRQFLQRSNWPLSKNHRLLAFTNGTCIDECFVKGVPRAACICRVVGTDAYLHGPAKCKACTGPERVVSSLTVKSTYMLACGDMCIDGPDFRNGAAPVPVMYNTMKAIVCMLEARLMLVLTGDQASVDRFRLAEDMPARYAEEVFLYRASKFDQRVRDLYTEFQSDAGVVPSYYKTYVAEAGTGGGGGGGGKGGTTE